MAKLGVNVSHATGSQSFTQTLRKVVARRVRGIRYLFRYTSEFGDAERNGLDVLIVDEAHRIRLVTSYPFMKPHKRSGVGQADELVRAARVPVFLLDEHQGVRPQEIGTVASIEEACARNGAEVHKVALDGQFSCGGSETYVRWVERLLGLRPGGPQPWPGDDTFQLAIAKSPIRMEEELRRKIEEGYTARITAGFCWPWSKPRPDGTLVDDIVIGSWRRPWNMNAKAALDGIPPSALWATDDGGFGQVGCIYTAQGFEYDYGAAIIGTDLVWREDHWESSAAASRDPNVRKADNFDVLTRNTYKVLLTRGLLGCVIYSVDDETRHMLAGLRVPALAGATHE
ncbi:MAG TPA: DNA/RNA helicase domain-containing protein [Streptosporangiaceae bacterium]